MDIPVIIVLVVVAGLIFDATNGFHDAANAIATVVTTKVLTYRQAVIMAAVMNLLGALIATNVAQTIEHGLVDHATQAMVLSAAIGAIGWNIITWRLGLPSSSSHALVGGLVGGSIAHAGLGSVLWAGVAQKVLLPMVTSPIAGLALGFLVMSLINLLTKGAATPARERTFARLQRFSAVVMAFAHGSNDAQKTMGMITLALVSAKLLDSPAIPTWVVLSSASAMAIGTLLGGRRIIETTGSRITSLTTVSGFAAETGAACVIFSASALGAPVSTTHIVVGSITGSGSAATHTRPNLGILRAMSVAWIFTLPGAAVIAAVAKRLLSAWGFV